MSLNKVAFLDKYRLQQSFNAAETRGLKWETLQKIYNDYESNYYDVFEAWAREEVNRLYERAPAAVRSIYGRAKNPEHLIEKIIRKIGKENKATYAGISFDNYRDKITDLIGIRILILKKEDWKPIDNHINNRYKSFEQDPVAYVCYGDRILYDRERMNTLYTNKGYRSVHYIVRVHKQSAEIQVRTLAEEVYGEFDHETRYPYNADNPFLLRYNRMVSKLTSELDDMISTGLSIPDSNLGNLGKSFALDRYMDFQQPVEEGKIKRKSDREKEGMIQAIDIKTAAHNRILKGRK